VVFWGLCGPCAAGGRAGGERGFEQAL
jgi:hypothetical protein